MSIISTACRLYVQEQTGYLHGESLEMVDRLEALGSEVLNEVLTAQTGEKAVWGEKKACLDQRYNLKLGLIKQKHYS